MKLILFPVEPTGQPYVMILSHLESLHMAAHFQYDGFSKKELIIKSVFRCNGTGTELLSWHAQWRALQLAPAVLSTAVRTMVPSSTLSKGIEACSLELGN
ncbi:jg13847 [Pararge aegeria aegeria]|uniref:Jg13847 protein n=1 Tax=Pararge aegeria aegeria TaxID=348720 RepID=A0A8S4S9C7_9NEOP|nr:jg13847 [Pararge aegeria aegeria]